MFPNFSHRELRKIYMHTQTVNTFNPDDLKQLKNIGFYFTKKKIFSLVYRI